MDILYTRHVIYVMSEINDLIWFDLINTSLIYLWSIVDTIFCKNVFVYATFAA
jgi:chemotaxis methyl-accepting protein methylase